jgi:hypothetical protein
MSRNNQQENDDLSAISPMLYAASIVQLAFLPSVFDDEEYVHLLDRLDS